MKEREKPTANIPNGDMLEAQIGGSCLTWY